MQDHHLTKCTTTYNLKQRNSRELYHMQLLSQYSKPTCQGYYEKIFNYDFNWKLIYRIPCTAIIETKICIFQNKLLNNVLYLKSYFILVYFPSLNVASVNYMNTPQKHPIIFFMNALINKIYGNNFDYIFQKKLHCQF